jgi:hypothetical protein
MCHASRSLEAELPVIRASEAGVGVPLRRKKDRVASRHLATRNRGEVASRHSVRSALVVLVRAAHPAGNSAPAMAMTRPPNANGSNTAR